jgi:UPF0176 protein
MSENNKQIAIISFYSFVQISDLNILLPQILHVAKKKYLKGTILLAEEGFNGTISGDLDKARILIDKIKDWTKAQYVNIKINYSDTQPFSRIKLKIKPEIISLKYHTKLNIAAQKGEYIKSTEWDDFVQQDDVIMVDTRNEYEVKIGSFTGALDPKTKTFREFPDWTKENLDKLKGKKIAMFCTGGIRCEKSTALLKDYGIDKVYHLEGGILQYLEDTENKNKLWQGECFVFDDRGAVSENLNPAEGYWVKKGQTAKSVSYSK